MLGPPLLKKLCRYVGMGMTRGTDDRLFHVRIRIITFPLRREAKDTTMGH